MNMMFALRTSLKLLVPILTLLAGRNYAVQGGADALYVGIPSIAALALFVVQVVLSWLNGKTPTKDDAQQFLTLLLQLLNTKGVDPAVKGAAIETLVQASVSAKPSAICSHGTGVK